MTKILPPAVLAILVLGVAVPPAVATEYPKGYEGMTKAAIELQQDQAVKQKVQKAIDALRTKNHGRKPQDYEVRQELSAPGFNWGSEEGAALNAQIEELLGQ